MSNNNKKDSFLKGAFILGLAGIIVSIALKGEAEELIEAKEMERKPKRRKFKK